MSQTSIDGKYRKTGCYLLWDEISIGVFVEECIALCALAHPLLVLANFLLLELFVGHMRKERPEYSHVCAAILSKVI